MTSYSTGLAGIIQTKLNVLGIKMQKASGGGGTIARLGTQGGYSS